MIETCYLPIFSEASGRASLACARRQGVEKRMFFCPGGTHWHVVTAEEWDELNEDYDDDVEW